MRKAMLAALALSCVHSKPKPFRRLFVDNTPEASACLRECMTVTSQCEAGNPGLIWGAHCEYRRRDCLMTCPGAHWEWVYPDGTPAPAPAEAK